MAKQKAYDHIADKDTGDEISKKIGNVLQDTSEKFLSLVYDKMLTGTEDGKSQWYKGQISSLKGFKDKVGNLAQESKESLLNATKEGIEAIKLNKRQTQAIEKEISTGIKDLAQTTINTYTQNVSFVYNQLKQGKLVQSDTAISLYNTIKDKIESTEKYGIVSYKNGRNIRWESYMEMKVRTEIQSDISKNMVKTGGKNGVIFYLASFLGDCAIDHVDFQGKIYVDEDWESIAPQERLDEIESYIKAHHIQTIQDITQEEPYLTTRPNCRHYFQMLSIDEVLGIKNEKELNAKREEMGLNYSGKYKPEKYRALAKQRYNERNIRHWKGQAEVHQKLLDKMPITASLEARMNLSAKIVADKRRVRQWQANQRTLIRNNPELERDYSREAYGKIRADLGAVEDVKISKLVEHEENDLYAYSEVTADYKSKDYKEAISKHIQDKELSQEVARCASLIFDNGKSRTLESVCIIDKNNLKNTFYNPNGKPGEIELGKDGREFLFQNSEYILIHNHRENTPPSHMDLFTAQQRKDFSKIKAEYLIFTNGGAIYYYKNVDIISERKYNQYVDAKSTIKDMENGLKRLAEEHNFVFEVWRENDGKRRKQK